MTDREIRQDAHMTDIEALMWRAERDPWLSSGMGSLFVLDVEPDHERLVETMRHASKTLLRLREKVVEGVGLAPPRWVIDDDFDIHDHVRHVRLPSPAGMRELLDLTAQVFEDPFDVHRPLWQFVAVEGAAKKGSVPGAIIMKLHHSVTDGIGAVRLAEMYMDIERNPAPKPEDDDPVAPPQPDTPRGAVEGVVADATHLAKRNLGILRQAAAEVSLWGADTSRARDAVDALQSAGKAVGDSFEGGFVEGGGSPLWANRSRHRHLEVFDISLDEVKAASKRLGVSINDVFVGGSTIAAARYHAEHDSDVTAFNLSFIVSTRDDDAAGGNSFAPIPFSVDASVRTVDEHLHEVQAAMAGGKDAASVGSTDLMDVVSGFANLLPSSVVTRAGRARSAKQDWATSNLRGAPFTLFVAGGEITHMYPVGPVAGTAFNLTTMSYNGQFHFGVFIDPKAVTDPANLRSHLEQAYADILSS